MKDDDDEDEQGISNARYPCIPSRVALMQMRNRLHLAKLGKKLMKWTALATMKELRKLATVMLSTYKDYEYSVRNCYILLARCRYFYPQLNTMVAEGLPQFPKKASVVVGSSMRCTTGAKVLQFSVYDTNTDNFDTLAIAQGGQAVQAAKKAWYDLLKLMILILELKMSFLTTEISHKNATKKSNVLGKIVIPRINVTIKYINDELEERDREDFFRMKKIINVKEKDRKRKKMELDQKDGKVAVPKAVVEKVKPKSAPPSPKPKSAPTSPKPKLIPISMERSKSLPPAPKPKSLPITPKSVSLPQTPKAVSLTPTPKESVSSVAPVPCIDKLTTPPVGTVCKPIKPPEGICPMASVCKAFGQEALGQIKSFSEMNPLAVSCHEAKSPSKASSQMHSPAVPCHGPGSKSLVELSTQVSRSNQQYFDVETKEITKIIRIHREDGTIIEEIKMIKIVKEVPVTKTSSKNSVSSRQVE